MVDYPFAQGQAKPATPEDIEKDEIGITKPNLHRRIENGNTSIIVDCYLAVDDDTCLVTEDDEFLIAGYSEEKEDTNEYSLFVKSVNSYRSTRISNHDENSNDSEIP